MLNRNKIVQKLINEGFSYKTLSLFNDRQLKELALRILKEQIDATRQAEIDADTAKQEYLSKQSDYLELAKDDLETDLSETEDIEDDEDFEKTHPKTKKIDTEAGELDLVLGELDLDDRHPNREGSGKGKSKTDSGTFEPVNYDVTKPKPHSNLSKKKELTHKGKGYIHEKDFSKLSKKSQRQIVESWIMNLIERKEDIIRVTKSKLIEMVNKIHEDEIKEIGGMTSDPRLMAKHYGDRRGKKTTTGHIGVDLFDSMEQEIAFERLNKWVIGMDGYELKIDELEKGEDSEESILLLYLDSPTGHVWDIMIYTDGNIYMDSAPINDEQDFEEEIKEKETRQEGELAETERDKEGEYIGAPVDTGPPVRIAPTKPVTRPGEKERRGPFKKPKTTPKPKAHDKKVPDWFNFDEIKAHVEKK